MSHNIQHLDCGEEEEIETVREDTADTEDTEDTDADISWAKVRRNVGLSDYTLHGHWSLISMVTVMITLTIL